MITTNTGAKKIEGTDNWREIFDAHNDSVNAHDKVSEAMTYVVNGNKSIENAAIPVGSYVRLANSTIVGRSDGIYTVKTAIPVNTVIDSSYFNENAPIPGGVANALNSKIDNIESPISISGTGDNLYVACSSAMGDFNTIHSFSSMENGKSYNVKMTWTNHDYYSGVLTKYSNTSIHFLFCNSSNIYILNYNFSTYTVASLKTVSLTNV